MKSIKQQIEAIESALKPWAKDQGGTAAIVSDFVHLVESILSQKPGVACAYIVFNSQLPRSGTRPRLGRVDNGFLVVISCGRSLQMNKGDLLVIGSAGNKPMFQLVEEAREICLGIEFDADPDECAEFVGIRPFQEAGFLMDAYQIEFSVGGQNVQR